MARRYRRSKFGSKKRKSCKKGSRRHPKTHYCRKIKKSKSGSKKRRSTKKRSFGRRRRRSFGRRKSRRMSLFGKMIPGF